MKNVQPSVLSTSVGHILERDGSVSPRISVQSERTSPPPQPINEGRTLHIIKRGSAFNQKSSFLKWLMSARLLSQQCWLDNGFEHIFKLLTS